MPSKKTQKNKNKTHKNKTHKNKTHKNKTHKNKTHKKKLFKCKKPLVVGILTVPLSPDKRFFSVCGDSYVASSHITWLKRANIEVIPIPYTTNNPEKYMKLINGLYFPSGGAFAVTQKTYYDCCKKFLQLAMEENDNGNYFPIWGSCMGMQQLMIIGDGKDNLDNLLTQFDSFNNLLLPLDITEEGKHCRILKGLSSNFLKKIQTKKCTMNNHRMGLSPIKFKKCNNLYSMFKIVSTNKDRKGKKFVSTIEGRYYPFYGVQWHPERGKDMDELVNFFARELCKNKNKINPKKTKKLKKKMYTKKINCMNYSGDLYKKCNFYWHKHSSKHNHRLCNNAQTQNDGCFDGV